MMSQKTALMNAMGFEYLLLDSYKQLGLNENEVMVSLMIHHLSEQGNTFVDSKMLNLKMSLSVKDIDEAMSSLLKKKYLIFEKNEQNGLSMSLSPLEDKVRKEFAFALSQEQANSMNKEKENTYSRLLSLFEEKLARTLSPLEISTLKEWLDNGYSEDMIKNALLDTIASNKKSLRDVNKVLISRRKQDDIEKEGASAVNDRWDKSVEETIRAAKALWGDPSDDK